MNFNKLLSTIFLSSALAACNSSGGGSSFEEAGEPFDPLGTLTPLGGFTPKTYANFAGECQTADEKNCVEQINGGLLPVVINGLAAIPGVSDLLGLLGADDLYSVENIEFSADGEPETYAVLNLPANLLGDPTGFSNQFTSSGGLGDALVISGGVRGKFSGTQGRGNVVAFDVELPADTIGVTVIQNLSVRTYLNGELSEQFEALAPLDLTLLGQSLTGFAGDTRFLVGCRTQQAYDAVEISVDGVVNADLVDNILGDSGGINPESPLATVAGDVLKIYGIVQGATAPADSEETNSDCTVVGDDA